MQIIDNFLNGNGDDLIAIQGTYLLVINFDASQKAVTVAIGNPLGCGPMRDYLVARQLHQLPRMLPKRNLYMSQG